VTDHISPELRSRVMGRVRGKNTEPEKRVRRPVHGMGFRYRLHRRDLPSTPDLVLIGRKKVIFVHGCFWHQHNCPCRARSSSNVSFVTFQHFVRSLGCGGKRFKVPIDRTRMMFRELRGESVADYLCGGVSSFGHIKLISPRETLQKRGLT